MSYTARRAETCEDMHLVALFYLAYLVEAEPEVVSQRPETIVSLVENALYSGRLTGYLICEEDKPIGSTLAGVELTVLGQPSGTYSVVGSYVCPEKRRFGTRKPLMELVREDARKAGCTRVRAIIPGLRHQRVYERYGWRADGVLITLEV